VGKKPGGFGEGKGVFYQIRGRVRSADKKTTGQKGKRETKFSMFGQGGGGLSECVQ